MSGEIAEIAATLSEQARAVMKHDRFCNRGWEPRNPSSPIVAEMVDAGLFVRRDGRCGWEKMKDAFIVPTPLGLAVRTHLITKE